MNVINWILQNWDIILAVIVVIAAIIYAIKTGNGKLLRAILFAAVTAAEKEFGGGTGELKKSTVLSWVYEKLPSILKMLFSETQLSVMIENALAEAKEKWKENPALLE